MDRRSLAPLLAVLYGSGFLAGFNENLVNMALVSVMGEFSVDAVTAQWLVTGYMIAVTVVVTCMAYLYRRFTPRSLFLAAAALSLAGSLLGLLAPSFAALMAGRLVQAVGTGIFIPLMMNVIVDAVPRESMGSYLAVGSAVITLGPATAPVATGFIVSYLGWRSVFAVPLAGAALLLAAGALVVRVGGDRGGVRMDAPSVALAAAGLTALTYGLSELALSPVPALLSLAGAAVLLGLFARRQGRCAHPLVSLAPLRSPAFWPAAVLVVLAMMSSFSLSVMVPLYLEDGAGMAASAVGGLLLVPVAANALSAMWGGRVMDRRGEWPLLPAGFAVTAAGFAAVAAMAMAGSVALVVVGVFIAYAGSGLLLSPSQTAGLRTLDDDQTPHGVALMSMAVQLAACMGPAAYVGIMTAVEGAVGAADAAGAWALGADAASVGFAASMAVACTLAAGGLALAWRYARRMRRERAEG
ncbi:MAG: multidrug efflux MFS transporter [Eggerthellaceae bacterium]|nr:multidrug efflux MFS transporter [Eggerthellaceae bacterium]